MSAARASPVVIDPIGTVALLSIDDGKANALSFELIGAISDAIRESATWASSMVIAGRPGYLSAGLDLSVVSRGDEHEVHDLMSAAAELYAAAVRSALPIVAACTGHALAGGSMLLLAADYRVGTDGDFKLGFTETAIGVPMPLAGVRLAEQRLDPSAVHRLMSLGELVSPSSACDLGLLDEIVKGDAVARAVERATTFAALDRNAFATTKARVLRALVDTGWPLDR